MSEVEWNAPRHPGIGDIVRIKPFTDHYGKIVDIRPEDPQSVAVQSSAYAKGRVVWLRPQDIQWLT
jgi:hypothetical protein